MKNKKIFYSLTLILILVLAFYLRILNIETAPPGIYPDEAVNGQDALKAEESGNYQWFYPDNNGREGLFMNLIALCFKFLGVSIFALKLPSIIFGVLTVAGIYFLTKELFQKENPALIASFLTAVSFWSLNFSRISFRAIMLPAVLVWSAYFFWKGMRTKKITSFLWGGLIFGLGLHTYIAFRIAPVILIIALVAFWLNEKNFWRKYWKQILTFVFASFLVALPMILTFLIHPEFLESRSASISILSPEVNQGDLVGTFFKSLGLSLAKYNFWGDQNWRHNYPPYPILDPLTGLAFLIGIIYAVFKFFQLIFRRIRKKQFQPKMNAFTFLLAWFFIMLAPEFMTAEGLPHALRAIGTIPPVMIFSGMAFNFWLEKSQKSSPKIKKLLLVLLFSTLIFVGLFNSIKYHLFWANQKETAVSFEKVLLNISHYLEIIPEEKPIFIITGNMQRVPIKLLNHQRGNITYLTPGELVKTNIKNQEHYYLIMTQKNEADIDYVKNLDSEIKINEIPDSQGITFYVIKK